MLNMSLNLSDGRHALEVKYTGTADYSRRIHFSILDAAGMLLTRIDAQASALGISKPNPSEDEAEKQLEKNLFYMDLAKFIREAEKQSDKKGLGFISGKTVFISGERMALGKVANAAIDL